MPVLLGADIGGFTFEQMWASMGFFARGVVFLLFAMSLASVAVFVERLAVFRTSVRQTRLAAAALSRSLPAFLWDDARKTAAAYDQSHLARVVGAGVADVLKAPELPPEDQAEGARRAMERARDREAAALRRGLGILATTGSTAPFVGLLGTVAGIINAFKTIAATGSGGLASVSAGIAEALVTTAMGLFVAIMAVMAFNLLGAIADRLTLEMSDSAIELYDLVVKSGAKARAPGLRSAQG